MTDPIQIASTLRDALCRFADALSELLLTIAAKDAEISRLKIQNREMAKLMDEQVDPVDYKAKEVN